MGSLLPMIALVPWIVTVRDFLRMAFGLAPLIGNGFALAALGTASAATAFKGLWHGHPWAALAQLVVLLVSVAAVVTGGTGLLSILTPVVVASVVGAVSIASFRLHRPIAGVIATSGAMGLYLYLLQLLQ